MVTIGFELDFGRRANMGRSKGALPVVSRVYVKGSIE